jgi:hypothetical protein
VHGFCDAVGLLGPVPTPWKIHFYSGRPSRNVCLFFNTETGVSTYDDPRLGTVPQDWEIAHPGTFALGNVRIPTYRSKKTGEITDRDPRLLPDFLRERGVNLEMFELV